MSRKNYTKYSQMNKEENKEVVLDKTSFEEVINEQVDELVEEIDLDNIVENEFQNEELIEALKDVTGTGIVTGCAKLRVRKAPSSDAEVYGTIDEDTEVAVTINKSTEEFYQVNTIINGTLVAGYCMKKFIKIK